MKKYQIKPTRQFVIPNDALSQLLFNGKFSVDAGKTVEEKITVSGRKKIYDTAKITNTAKYRITLNEFDRAVFDAVVSELTAGNEYFTPSVVYRNLGGSVTHSVSKHLKKKILESLEKLNFLRITLDLSESAKKTRYDVASVGSDGRAMLVVPEKIIFNGAETTAMKICSSILLDVAAMRKQILHLKMENLKIPILHTERAIVIEHYISRRVAEISGSLSSANRGKNNQKLQPIILFDELFERCGFQNLSRCDKQRIREISAQILDDLVAKTRIFSWKFGFAEKGEIRSINLDLTPPQKCEAVK